MISQPSSSNSRRIRLVLFAITVAIVLIGAGIGLLTLQAAAAAGRVGADLDLYLRVTRSALAGEGFYPLRQLAGPYPIADGDVLYPPPVIGLFVPFLLLPAVLFWVVPLGIVAAVVVRHRPRPWTWPLMALGFAFPITTLKLVHGNPVMWITAAVALGTLFAWPSVFVLLKPSLAPFALIGAHRRSWWLALGALIVAAIPFGALWLDYAKVVLDSRNPHGILYSLEEVPFVLIPVLAWIGSPGFRMPGRLARFRTRGATSEPVA